MWDSHGDRYDMMNGGGSMVGFGVLVVVLLAITVVALLANLYLHLPRHSTTTPAGAGPSEARLTLDRRLANGEVTPDEYVAVRATLEG